MASDLSKLIQDSFTLTLNGLLAKDAKILKITKTHPYDLEDRQLLQIQALFDFKTFTSKFSYYIPAKSASLIFNTMMGSPITELSDEIDDDAEDAIGEFISNTCGGLTTAVNGTEFEDIGKTKFNISHKEILNGDTLENLDNMYRFLIDLEDNELVLFIDFDESILPFIPEITKSEITFHQERAEKPTEEEIIEEIENKIAQKEEDVPQEEPKEEVNNSKNNKLALIKKFGGIAAGAIFLIFIILYFIGVFDSETVEEEPKPADPNIVKEQQTPKKQPIEVVKYETPKKVDFNISSLNQNRLNNKLKDLTKYSVLSPEELEQQQEAERLRLLELAKEEKLIEFAKNNHEEPVVIEKEPIKTPKMIEKQIVKQLTVENTQTMPIPVSQHITTDDTPSTLHYVVTSSLKYRLFKAVVQETATTKARISICNNINGKTTIYIGPFETQNLQLQMIAKTEAKSDDSQIELQAVDITEKQFNARCNLE